MTLVLASRCVDGIVVIANRAITDLRTLEILKYDNKLSGVIRNVIFGYMVVDWGILNTKQNLHC